MTRTGRATVVLASGALAEVTAERIVYSAATAHLFERAVAHIAATGNAALQPVELDAWATYNFEVEDLHTYVAEGVRVHNDSGWFGELGTELFSGGVNGTGVDGSGLIDRFHHEGLIDTVGDGLSNFAHGVGTVVNEVIDGVGGALESAAKAAVNGLNSIFGPGGNSNTDEQRTRTSWTDQSGQTHWGSMRELRLAEEAGKVGSSGNDRDSKGTGSQSKGADSQSKNGGNTWQATKDAVKQTWDTVKSWFSPVLLDLDGNGVSLAELGRSTVFLDSDGDGLANRTAWAGVGDGVLFYDAGNDGKITQDREFVFTEWDPTAKDDMAALRSRFDSNNDGKLTSADAEWSSFKVMVTNADGTQSAQSLSSLGITSIDLKTNATEIHFADGSEITGQTTFTINGQTRTAATATLVSEAEGHRVELSQDGKTWTTYDAAGHVISTLTSTQVVSGNTRTTTNAYDDDGDGSVDRVQVVTRSVVLGNDSQAASDDTVTETIQNYRGATAASGQLLDSVTTVTSPGGAVTINRDQLGGGWHTEREVRNVSDGTDGFVAGRLQIDVSELAPGGTTVSRTQEIVSASGLVRTMKHDMDGRDGFETIETHTIADDTVAGARTESTVITNHNGSTRSQQVLTTTGNGRSNTLRIDADGDGHWERQEVRTIGLDSVAGSVSGSTSTETVTSETGLQLGKTVTVQTVDALDTTETVYIGSATDWIRQTHEVTAIEADGAQTTTTTVTSHDGSILSNQQIRLNANKITGWTKVDLNHDGVFATNENELVRQVTVSGSGTSQVVTETDYDRTTSGGVRAKAVHVTEDGGLTTTSSFYENSDGTVDRVVYDTTYARSGVETAHFVDTRNGDGTSRGSVLTTAVASTMVEVTYVDRDHHEVNGTGTYDLRIVDDTNVNADHSVTQVITTQAIGTSYAGEDGNFTSLGTATLLASEKRYLSANRQNSVVVVDSNGDGRQDHVTWTSLEADGSRKVISAEYAANATFTGAGLTWAYAGGTILSQEIRTTSANGLATTVTTDSDGDGSFETAVTDTTVLGLDGSITRSVVTRDGIGADASVRGQSKVVTSDDGMTVTTSLDLNGDGNLTTGAAFDRITTSVRAFLATGDTRTTETVKSANGQTLGSVMATVSGDGLKTTTIRDLNGDGTYDLRDVSAKSLNADGSSTVTRTASTLSGEFLGEVSTWTSGDQLHQTVTYSDFASGSTHVVNREVKVDEATSGVVTTSDKQLDGSGTLLRRTLQTVTADGGLTTVQVDSDGNGVYERQTTTAVVLGIAGNGSRIVTESSKLSNGTVYSAAVSETSDDGQWTAVTRDIDGNGTIDWQAIATTAISNTGVKTVTVEHRAGGSFVAGGHQEAGSNLLDRQVTVSSSDGRTITASYDQDGNGQNDRVVTRTVDNQGRITTVTEYKSSGGVTTATDVEVVSGNGLSRQQTIDRNADGRAEQVILSETRMDAFGTTWQQVERYTDRNILIGSEEYSASSNGLFRTAVVDLDGDGILDFRSEDLTVYAANGEIHRLQESWNETAALLGSISTVTSGNGLETDIFVDYDGDGGVDRLETLDKTVDGAWSQDIRLFGSGVTLTREVVETMSRDGRDHLIRTDLDGDGTFDKSVHAVTDGMTRGTTTTYADLNGDGSDGKVIVGERGANGAHTTYSMDLDGDGTVDLTRSVDITYLAANASTMAGAHVETVRDVHASGKTTYVETTTTSANGLVRETTYDIDGNGKIDGKSVSTTVLGADGSSTVTDVTNYTYYDANGVMQIGDLRSKSTVFTSADHRTQITRADYDGNGIDDKVVLREIGADGSTTVTETSYSVGGMPGQQFVTTTSSDGLVTTINRAGNQQTIIRSAVNNGSYTWNDGLTPNGSQRHTVVSHEIDQFGVETWSVTDQTSGSTTTTTARLDQAAKALVMAEAAKIYDAILDRDMDFNEAEVLARFVSFGQLDRLGLVNSLLSSNEFVVRYGTLSNAEFVAQLSLNAFGRGTTLDEMSDALNLLSSGTTRKALALMLSDSVEHDVVGNGHLATNNFDVIMNPVQFERSVDRVYVENVVRALIDTVFDRDATASEISYYRDCLMEGTTTVKQLAEELRTVDHDTQGNGSNSLFFHSRSNSDFVSQAFANGLGRGPTSEEQQVWESNLTSGLLTKADLIVVIAQSLDHAGALNQYNASTGTWVDQIFGGTGDNPIHGGSDADSIAGNNGVDTIWGGGGSDWILGGLGRDTLFGGSGSDRYFWATGDGGDRIDDQCASRADTDSLEFSGVSSSSVTFTRVAEYYDLELRFTDAEGHFVLVSIAQQFIGDGSGTGIENFVFSDRVITREDLIELVAVHGGSTPESLSGSDDRDHMIGGTANDTINGAAGDDTIEGKSGADALRGGTGEDRYIWARGDGADTIDDVGTDVDEIDRLVFSDSTITANDVTVTRSGNNLLLTIGGTNGAQLTIKNRLESTTSGKGIEIVEFADGSSWLLTDLLDRVVPGAANGTAYADNILGTAGAETLSGADGNDTLNGLEGADELQGGNGADSYIWLMNHGSDTVNDTGSARTETDTLDLRNPPGYSGGVLSTETTLTRVSGSNDLKVTVGSETITIKDQFSDPTQGRGIERILFKDGVVWTLEDIVSRTRINGTSSNDTLGSDTALGTGAFDDNLYGYGGNDILSAGAGDDDLYGGTGVDSLYGGTGSDRYVWVSGDGNDQISDTGTSARDVDVLALGVAASAVSFSKSGNTDSGYDLLVTTSGGATITVKGEFPTQATNGGIELITFSDGTSVSIMNASVATIVHIGASADDTLTGWAFQDMFVGEAGNDTLSGVGGNDTFDGGVGADSLAGGNGNDDYLWTLGDGNDVINDEGTSLTEIDRLVLQDVDSTGVTLSRLDSSVDGSKDMLLTVTNGGALITIKDRYASATQGKGIETIVFADGVTWQLDDLLDRTVATAPAAGGTVNGTGLRDFLLGSAYEDTLTGSAGNDTLQGTTGADVLDGGDGDDTYVWNKTPTASAGDDTIIDTATGATDVDVLDFSGSVSSTAVTLTRASGTNDLLISVAGTPDTIKVLNQYLSATGHNGIEMIRFADEVVWTLDDILNHTRVGNASSATALSLNGTALRDHLFGGTVGDTLAGKVGDDTLDGGAGADTLYGDDSASSSSGGDDIYVWTKGDGDDQIIDKSTSLTETDTLDLSQDVVAGDVRLYRVSGNGNGKNNLLIEITNGGTTELLTVVNRFEGTNLGYGIEKIQLADAVWYLEDILARTEVWGDAAGAGNDSLVGTDYTDNLFGGAEADTLNGGNGDDKLTGGAGTDALNGGAGVDIASYASSAAGVAVNLGLTVQTGAGDVSGDVLSLIEGLEGSAFADTLFGDDNANDLYGGGGNDQLIGYGGFDRLYGGDGNDVMQGAGDENYFDGGTGSDCVTYAAAASGVAVDLMVPDGNSGDADGDMFLSIENLRGSAFGDTLLGADWVDVGVLRANNTIWGDAGNDVIYGRAGNDWLLGETGADTLYGGADDDVLNGGADNDVLNGGAGNDNLSGSTGNDTYVVDATGDVVVENADAGTDLVQSSITRGLEANVENLTLTGTANIDGTGNGLDNILIGNSGANQLIGSGGDDSLSGGDGADSLYGGAGADTLNGGTGSDWALADSADSGFVADLTTPSSNTGNALGDSYVSIENLRGGDNADDLRGNAVDNVLEGGDGNDTLHGRDGEDTLCGGAGDDRIAAGAGADLIDGGEGSDWSWAYSTDAGFIADLDNSGLNTGIAAGDTYVSIENLRGGDYNDDLRGSDDDANILDGWSGADSLTGRGGNDSLYGGSGADTLDGGEGRDFLYGGSADGAHDEFVFDAATESAVGANRDVVYNFVSGIDQIRLSAIDANTGTAGNQAFSFSGSTAAAWSVWTSVSGSDLILRGDNTGDGVADFEIQVSAVSSLVAADFIL